MKRLIAAVTLLLVYGCKSDALTSKTAIRDRAAWLTMERHDMRAEAHRNGLGSICVLPVRGTTQLVGAWQSPAAQLEVDERERSSFRTQLANLFTRMGFAVVERTEEELRQIEHEATHSAGRLVSVEGYIGRKLGAELIATVSLDVLREAYFVPYVGWKSRGWTTFTERYWNARTDSLLVSFVWNDREREFRTRGIRDTALFKGYAVLGTAANPTQEQIDEISNHFSLVDPVTATWQTNYTLAGWFFTENRGMAYLDSADKAIAHLREIQRKRPTDVYLCGVVGLKILELQGNAAEAGEKSIEVAQLLAPSSALWHGEVQRAARLKGMSVSEVTKLLGGGPRQAAVVMAAFDADALDPAVVMVVCTRADETVVYGSGFMVTGDGLLVTNAHVVEGAQTISIKFWDGVAGSGELVARNETVDLAVIRVTRRDLPVLELSDARAKKGTIVYAVGNPSTLEGTITKGIVSGYRSLADAVLVQTDAAINPGNSGCPIVDEHGMVVGVATFVLKDTQGLNFGVAAETVRDFLTPYVR